MAVSHALGASSPCSRKFRSVHLGCKYMRGHRLRRSHLHAVARGSGAEWEKDDWDLLAELLPSTAEAAADFEVTSWEKAVQHLSWLNTMLRNEVGDAIKPWSMAEITMTFCLRPCAAKLHKDTDVPFHVFGV